MVASSCSEMRILIAEDERRLASAIARGLRREGMAVDITHDGASALVKARVVDYDVVVLDRDLPELHGDEVCRLLSTDERGTKVLMLTAADTTDDLVDGLALGADDYLPKPFSPQELVLRVGAVLRRLAAPAVAAGGVVTAGPLVLDKTAHRVTVGGVEIELTATEFKLLHTLLEREGRVQSRAQLLETVWRAQPDIQTRTVDMHVQRLRHKLGKTGACIETVRGAGYRFRRPESRGGTGGGERGGGGGARRRT
jgi:DNA-binding response OmpR family regulator